MEIGVSPLVPSCNRVTINTATLTIGFADTIDTEIARRDASKAFAKLTDGAAGSEVMAVLHTAEHSVRLESRPGCDEDVAQDEAIELFANFVRQSFGQDALDKALEASWQGATVRIRVAKQSPASAMAVKKAEIARLIAKLQEQVAAMPTDSAKWGNVGDAGYVVEQLGNITATFNNGEPV